jgi:hypothetical protein
MHFKYDLIVFTEFNHFVEAFEDMGCMELVGMEKQRGMYLARKLSFEDVIFDIFEVDVDQNLVKIYDQSVALWEEFLKYSHWFFTEAENRQTIDQDSHRTFWLHFWAAHSDFFKYLCISAKTGRRLNGSTSRKGWDVCGDNRENDDNCSFLIPFKFSVVMLFQFRSS